MVLSKSHLFVRNCAVLWVACFVVLGVIVLIGLPTRKKFKDIDRAIAASNVEIVARSRLLELGMGMQTARKDGVVLNTLKAVAESGYVRGLLPGTPQVFSNHCLPVSNEFGMIESVSPDDELSRVPMLWLMAPCKQEFGSADRTNTTIGRMMVLFWDGHVRFVSVDELSSIISEHRSK